MLKWQISRLEGNFCLISLAFFPKNANNFIAMADPNKPELPPFFKTWQQMYGSVIVYVGLLVLFLYWFSNLFK